MSGYDIERALVRIEEIDREIAALHAEHRAIRERIDEVRLAERPEYPTQAQRDDIALGLQMLADGYREKSHHGDPVRENDWASPVRIAHLHGYAWLSIEHKAPYAKGRLGSKLWHFTDAEENALIEIVQSHGWHVLDFWGHDSGLSIRCYQEEAS